MSAQQQHPAGAAGLPSGGAPAVQQLVLQAELHAASVTEALTHYEAALEQLNLHIRSLPPGSPAQAQHIQQFKELLTTAEVLKQQQQAEPSAAEYSWRKRQAQHLAQQVGGLPDCCQGGAHVKQMGVCELAMQQFRDQGGAGTVLGLLVGAMQLVVWQGFFPQVCRSVGE